MDNFTDFQDNKLVEFPVLTHFRTLAKRNISRIVSTLF